MVTNWLAELDGRRVTVEVPASSANLGAGYDCLGVALGLFNRVEVEVRSWSRGEIELTVDGEGVGELAADRTNRCVLGIEAAMREVRGEIPEGVGWRIEMHNEIPLARGLGSSAAATVAGLVAGNSLLSEPLTSADLLRLATAIEGHPDNAAAALLGGFTVCALTDDGIESLRFDAPRDLRAVLFIPEVRLATDDMRAALPAKVPLEDAVANLSRVAIGVAGMAMGRFDLLRVLTVDRLHEQYRAKAYPQLPQFVAAARKAGAIGACLSGAGSTILAFSDSVRTISRIEGAFGAAAADTDLPGRIAVVSPRNLGAHLVSRA
ncbi:MAG TPA: homoserine kinase [Candidatus Limnocylindrales bacterium]|nr:homoserine kinase [Candidatus Limnocylindrales bacterium]